MRWHRPTILAVLLVAMLGGATIGYSQATGGSRQQWEYLMIEWTDMREAGLKRLGEQGWELVPVDTELKKGDHNTTISETRYTNESYFYFKRPK